MKVRIVEGHNNDKIKTCPDCNHTIFRKSTRSRYTNKEKTKGLSYELLICDNCNHREERNKQEWTVKKWLSKRIQENGFKGNPTNLMENIN